VHVGHDAAASVLVIPSVELWLFVLLLPESPFEAVVAVRTPHKSHLSVKSVLS
jgi:hypothetical protein